MRKKLFAVLICSLFFVPAFAVFNETKKALERRAILEYYENCDSINYVLFAKQSSGRFNYATLYEKKEGRFEFTLGCCARLGKNGIGKQREGDGKTPSGVLKITGAFGFEPNPGTSLPYIQLTPTTIACDCEGPYYNTIIDTLGTGIICQGERMYDYTKAYKYGLRTDYNSRCEYPKGSAIFIHSFGESRHTAGCIALDESIMKRLLLLADKGLIIYVN